MANKILGLDLGSRTCGVAMSDLSGFIAAAKTTIRFQEDDYDTCMDKVIEIIDQENIKTVVLGLPKHMNGDIGERGQLSIEFKEVLESERDVEVILWDERLTTVAAQKMMIAADMNRSKRKEMVDSYAAVMILQGYLDSKGKQYGK